MLENGKISPRQYMIITALFTVGDAILYVPSWLAEEAKQDAWLAALLCLGEALLLAALYAAIAKRYPGSTPVQYSESLLGRWLGAAIALFFILFFIVDSAIILLELGDFLTTQIMQETPIEAVLILFALSIVVGARLGLETITRSSELLFPGFLILFFILIVFLWPQVEVKHILPILGEGMKPVWGGSWRFTGIVNELVILMMLFPFVNNPRKAAQAYTIGVGIGIFLLALVTLVAILVLGHALTSLYGYPSYALAQKISVGRFFERIEAVMAFIWFITLYSKIAICFYAASLGIAQLLRLKGYRFLTLPLGMLMHKLATVFVPNRPYLDMFYATTWTPYTLTFGTLLPLIYLLVAWLRKRPGQP